MADDDPFVGPYDALVFLNFVPDRLLEDRLVMSLCQLLSGPSHTQRCVSKVIVLRLKLGEEELLGDLLEMSCVSSMVPWP